MESGPAMDSMESLLPTTTRSSLPGSRASSQSPTKHNTKRKFSLAAKMRSASDANLRRERQPSQPRTLPAEDISKLMGKIPNTQNSKDNKTFRELALKQLERVPSEHLPQVLEEYTRIPHTLLPNEMLRIPLQTRMAVRESVAKARAALVARVNAENEEEDRQATVGHDQTVHTRTLRQSQGHQQPSTPSTSHHLVNLPVASATVITSASCGELHNQVGDVDDRRRRSHLSLATMKSTIRSVEDTDELTPTSPTTELLGRSLKDTGSTKHATQMAKCPNRALTPPSSCDASPQDEFMPDPTTPKASPFVGVKHPSKNNPFASFITERSDADAERLPDDLALCYFAHNQVQDQLRSAWRLKQKSITAEQVARELWEQLPQRMYDVSVEFEGQLAKRALNKEHMIYIWVYRFWQRAKERGW